MKYKQSNKQVNKIYRYLSACKTSTQSMKLILKYSVLFFEKRAMSYDLHGVYKV